MNTANMKPMTDLDHAEAESDRMTAEEACSMLNRYKGKYLSDMTAESIYLALVDYAAARHGRSSLPFGMEVIADQTPY